MIAVERSTGRRYEVRHAFGARSAPSDLSHAVMVTDGQSIRYLRRDEYETEEEDDMRLTAKQKEGQCRANRCKQEPRAVLYDGDEEAGRVCLRHEQEARAQGWETAIEGQDDPTGVEGNEHSPSKPYQSPVPPADREALSAQQSEAEQLLEYARTFTIDTQEDLDLASQAISEASTKRKTLDERRRTITKPLDDAKKAVQSLFKPPMELLERVEREFKARVSEHAEREQERNREAMERGESSAMTAVGEAEGVQTRQRWTYEITAEDAVPRELCSPDPKKIQQLLREARDAGRDPAELGVPGVTFYQKTEVATKGGQK